MSGRMDEREPCGCPPFPPYPGAHSEVKGTLLIMKCNAYGHD